MIFSATIYMSENSDSDYFSQVRKDRILNLRQLQA